VLEFVPYTREWPRGVQEFNQRMVAGGLENELRFPEKLEEEPHSSSDDALFQEYFLAVEGSDVRGAYFLTHERWVANGQRHRVANFRLPISEGFVDPKYRGTGRALLDHALNRNRLLYCLGLGGKNRPLAKMLARHQWTIADTAFYFRCVQPREVLLNLTCLRTNPSWRLVMDAVAQSGGWVGIAALQRLRRQEPSRQVSTSLVADFGDWADELWERASSAYSMLADRHSTELRNRYPADDPRFQRLLVSSGSQICGWAVVLATTMRDHRHFGSLKVGTIVDCLALPGSEHDVICAATAVLEARGVGIIVSNQSHRNWRGAFGRAGFLSGPTNRFFTPSPELERLLKPFGQKFPLTHLTRGDGAGPIHL